VRQFDDPACVVVKHANPCGVAVAKDIQTAYDRAYRTDPTSAYGGIIAFNRPLDAATANTIFERQFVELIIAPDVDADTREICARRENLRLLTTGNMNSSSSRYEVRSVNGGLLLANSRSGHGEAARTQSRHTTQTSAARVDDLMFAWRVCKYVKSNAIVYVKINDRRCRRRANESCRLEQDRGDEGEG